MDKLTLFDHIFKPKVITLENGHQVLKKRSRKPLILLVLLVVMWVSFVVTGFDLDLIFRRGKEFFVILRKIFNPDFSYYKKVVNPLLDTVKMSLLGTILGCLTAFPVAILASSNINRNRIVLVVIRFILSIIRSVPTLIIASIFALIFGLGTFAGMVSIAIFTLGIVSKMLFESIEVIDMGPFEAMISYGCNQFRAFWAACLPQILPTYLAQCLYCFEINIRAAAILGYVGAGGIGILISERIGWRDYNGLGTVLLSLFMLVLCIDQLSGYLRSKLS
ncbi:MAG: phosphonate ABC transporter, permease protein PhnE [Erysipelotrichaceae bacterium]|nr:phosphonate ABC transporter, permease protein PhnE [Erysipelotrichaceae bacterium]